MSNTMLHIPYTHGEMNIDIVKFIENRNLNDIRYLVKDIIAISPERYNISEQIHNVLRDIEDGNIKPYYGYAKGDYEKYQKKLRRITEYLDKYIRR